MAHAGPRRVGANAVIVAVVLGGVLGLGAHELLSATVVPPVTTDVEVAGRVLERDGDGGAGASIVQVDAEGCGQQRSATATVVEHLGEPHVLTNAHVVRGSATAQVRTDDGRVLSATVSGGVPGRDAVLLELDDPAAVPPGRRLSSTQANAGDAVVVTGYPGGRRAEMRATVTAVQLRSGYGGTSPVLLIDAPAEGGLSGGAVLDAATGELVGLVAARDPRTGGTVAYPIAELLGRGLAAAPDC